MKKKFLIPVLISAISCFTIFSALTNQNDNINGDGHKYVGMNKCASVCHKGDLKGAQYEIWQASKHSQAYKDLQTIRADSIAKALGYTTSAANTAACIKCHVLGKDIDVTEIEPTFDKKQGVQCETCHGPGSDYKYLLIMKDKSVAINYGLEMHNEDSTFCKICHNPESPTYTRFKYDEFWAKISHFDPNIPK